MYVAHSSVLNAGILRVPKLQRMRVFAGVERLVAIFRCVR